VPERPSLERLHKQAKARKRERAIGLSAAQALNRRFPIAFRP
jgi:hypothetical protein